MQLPDDRVGPGRPPKHSQFRKGQSGNPTGRPKGTLNIATVLERVLREKVVINENGQRRTITKFEAAFKQQVNKAVMGDTNAFKVLSTLKQSGKEQIAGEGRDDAQKLREIDQKILQDILKRFRNNEGTEEDPE